MHLSVQTEELCLQETTGKYPLEGEALIIRRALNMQIKEDDVDQQRENILHTRCHIQNKVCSMIIDGGSCANVASDTLVKKLNLSCIKHGLIDCNG